jgi:hypothetical protein
MDLRCIELEVVVVQVMQASMHVGPSAIGHSACGVNATSRETKPIASNRSALHISKEAWKYRERVYDERITVCLRGKHVLYKKDSTILLKLSCDLRYVIKICAAKASTILYPAFSPRHPMVTIALRRRRVS